MIRIILVFVLGCQIGFAQTWSGEVGDSLWNSTANSIVFSLNNIDNHLVVSGAFTSIGSLTVNAIAKWDGDMWSGVGSGATMGPPYSVGKIENLLVAGGSFAEMGNTEGTSRLAIWDGVSWQGPSIGEVGFVVYDIDTFDNKLFIGGEFSNIGPYTFDKIAAFDGINWLNVGSCGSWVRTLEVFNGELYAGGYFGIKKFNGTSSWTVPYGGVSGRVMVMKTDTFNNFLYVGGSFDYVGGDTLSSCAAMWDGFSWNSLGYVINCDVMAQAMAIYRGDLYVGGCFETLYNGLNVNYIARWDGEQWHKVGNGFDAYVSAMGVYQDELYVGGYFTYVDGDIRAYGIARWHMPDTSCNYMKPRVQTLTDTFYLNSGEALAQFYNNNAYVDFWSWNFGDSGTDNVKDPLHTYTAIGDYDVQVTVTHNTCTKTANKTIHIALGSGISEVENIEFKVYPNPSDNFFNVEMDLPENKKCELRITSLNGHTKIIVPLTSETTQINTESWSKGTYVCNLFVDGKLVRSEKMILN